MIPGCGESISKKGYCAESKENGVLTNSRENAKKTEDSTRWCAHLPIIYKKPILLFSRQKSKTRGRGDKGTHHHSFRNAFIHTLNHFEMHTFTLIPFFEIHIISSTIFATARHELGRR